MNTETRSRVELCRIARILFQRGHNAPGDGNLSLRLTDGRLLCTPSQCHKGRLKPDVLVEVSVEGEEIFDARGRRVSSEVALHRAIYRRRDDIHAIVHAHSPLTVALTVAGHSLEHPVVPEAIQQLGGVPTLPYRSPSSHELAALAAACAGTHNAFVLERHGPVALGRSLEEAYQRLEVIEHTAKITLAALSIGSAEPLPESEAEKLREEARRQGVLPPL